MSILSRPKISAQQRFDLEDFLSLLSAARTDSLFFMRSKVSSLNLILQGFSVTGLGLNQAMINMSNAAFIIPQSTSDFSYFISSVGEPNIIIPDSSLTDNARNFVELALTTEDNTPLTKAFWDPEANSGNGAEFNQIVNTMTDLKCNAVVSTAGFSGLPDRLPLAIIDTNNTGVIKVILDRRNMFGRLAKPNDLDNEHAWGTKQEPIYSLTMTATSGSFIAGETINIGSETAKVVSGGNPAITFNEPSGINFENGDSVTGVTSGATGTIDTILESFSGVDKSLATQKQINDAIMTEIKKMKATRFWWQDAGSSLIGLSDFINSQLVQAVADTKFKWDGSNLSITNGALNPLAADVMAYLRQMGKSTNMSLARQDDGKEIQKVTFSIVPSAGAYTLAQNAQISNSINWNDNAAAVQAACNANWTNQVTVSGNTTDGFTFTFNTPGPQTNISQNSNTLTNGGNSVTLSFTTIKNGLAGISQIPIGSGEVLFIKIPTTGNRTFSGVGTGDTNYQVVDIEDYESIDGNYWLAYNEGGLLYIRGSGELQAGEESPISDPDKETILGMIATESAKSNQDRNAKLIEGGTWSFSLTGNNLTLSADAFVQIPGLAQTRNTISAQTVNLPNATSVAYIKLVRDSGVPVIRPIMVSDEDAIIIDSDTLVIARRVDDGVVVGSHSFLLQPGEFLTLDGALAEINKYFGQLKLRRHESALNKIRINSADVNLLNSDVLTKLVGPFVLDFSGAVINFTSGVINKEDDSTPLGVDFTPFSIPVGHYFWYGVSVIPAVVGADNRQAGQIQIEPAATSSATQGLALKPNISGDVPLGAIQIFNNAGTLEVAQIRRLGIGSGSGSGKVIKSNYLDPISTVLPSGPTVTIDGQSGVDGDLVLFTNLSVDNNRIYELSGVGVSIAWTPKRVFNSQFDPEDGDSVRVKSGDAFREQLAIYNGVEFLVNDVVRFFDGVSANFWELGSIKSVAIVDNTTDNVFTVAVAGSENMIVNYSIVRGVTKETGQLYITSDGTSVAVSKSNSYINDAGVEFTAQIASGNLELDYTASNLGSSGTMKFYLQRWSDAAGGPSGVPSYSGGGGGGAAGGANTEVQFNNSGNLDGDSRFKWDGSLASVDLNGLKISALSSGVTLNDNQAAPALAIQYAKTFNFAIIEYSIQRNTDYRVGRLLVPNDGSSVSLNDDFVETASTGITFSASISGANVNINYTSTATGNAGLLKYSIRRWA